MSRHSGGIRKCRPFWVFTPPRLSVVTDVDEIPRLRTFQNPRGQAGRAGTRGVGVHVQAPGLALVDTHGGAAASGGRRNQRRIPIRLNMRRALSGSARRRRSVFDVGLRRSNGRATSGADTLQRRRRREGSEGRSQPITVCNFADLLFVFPPTFYLQFRQSPIYNSATFEFLLRAWWPGNTNST